MAMNIIYATDENYAMYTGISICSLYDNNKNIDDITVHILDNGITDKSRDSLMKIANEYHRKMIFYDAKDLFAALAKKIKMKNTQTITTYASCFLADIMPDEMECALYVDGDSLFLGNLDELSQIDIKEYYVAGCLDVCMYEVREAIGLSLGDPYINAGFLYINFKKIRDNNLKNEISDFIRDVIPNSLHNDQDVVNGVLGKAMKILPAKYCVLTPLYERKYADIVRLFRLENYYTMEEVRSATDYPVFVHFTPSATKRPWVMGCDHPMKAKWDYYKSLTDWRNIPDKPDERIKKKRLLDWMFRNLNIRTYQYLTGLSVKRNKYLKKLF